MAYTTLNTRKPCYRKDDRAMGLIYGRKLRVFNIIYLLRNAGGPFLNFTCGPSADPTLADAECKFPHTTHHTTPLATLNSQAQPAACPFIVLRLVM